MGMTPREEWIAQVNADVERARAAMDPDERAVFVPAYDVFVHATYIPGEAMTACGIKCNPYHPIGQTVMLSGPERPMNCPDCLLALLPRMRHGSTPHAVLRAALAVRDGMGCFYCGIRLYIAQALPEGDKPPSVKGFVLIGGVTHRHCTIDHHIPKARGGSDLAENLRLCCGPCNSRKGEKMPTEIFSWKSQKRSVDTAVE